MISVIAENVFSQSSNFIKGRVVNGADDSPIGNCSVFINSTSKGTVTNASGEFELPAIPSGKFELVISSIGFETFVYPFSSDQLPLKLKVVMKQKSSQLAAVTVEPSIKHGWQLWGKTFVDNFIGKTANADACTIKNTKALHFFFSKKKNRLTVRSDEPLIIQNKALGYTVKYQLEEFYCDFDTHITLYLGYPLFQEMEASKRKQNAWKQERKKVYYGSVIHFMKCIYDNNLAEEGFRIIKTVKVINEEKQRVKELYKKLIPTADTFNYQSGLLVNVNKHLKLPEDSVAYYTSVFQKPDFYDKYISLNADSISFVQDDGKKSIFFTGKLHILYQNKKEEISWQSEINLVTPAAIQIEKNGSYYPPQELLSNGYWAIHEKFANTLPIDYQPD
jgi:hypothetical protein